MAIHLEGSYANFGKTLSGKEIERRVNSVEAEDFKLINSLTSLDKVLIQTLSQYIHTSCFQGNFAMIRQIQYATLMVNEIVNRILCPRKGGIVYGLLPQGMGLLG